MPVSPLSGDPERSESARGWAGAELGGRLGVGFSTHVLLDVEAADISGWDTTVKIPYVFVAI